MAIFEYQAYDDHGNKTKGVVEAETQKRARQHVIQQGLMVTTIRQTKENTKEGGSRTGRALKLMSGRQRAQRLSAFTRQLATLLSSGVPLAEAIDILVKQMPDISMETSLRLLCEHIKAGNTFAESLEQQRDNFSDLYINMVRAGESAGNLDVVLKRLAAYLQLRQEIQSKVVAALTYPAFVAGVAFCMFFVIMLFLVPRVATLLVDMGRELPPTTQAVLWMSDSLVQYWWGYLGAMVAAVLAASRALKTERVRDFIDEKKFRVPVFGALMQKAVLSRFALTYSTLMHSGIPALEALTIVGRAVANRYVAKQLENTQALVRDGLELSTALSKQSFFPPLVHFMVGVGEKSGQLSELLEEMGDNFTQELEIEMQRMVSVIEPLIILFVAAVVVVIILSILLPVMEMTSSFQ